VGEVQWDNDFVKRKKIKTILDTSIPEFSVRIGGTTSIDITKLGIDKAYGIRKLQDLLRISTNEMIFIGDALFAGANDYAIEAIGVVCIPVRGPSETGPLAHERIFVNSILNLLRAFRE
jgi:phosphomannomutase